MRALVGADASNRIDLIDRSVVGRSGLIGWMDGRIITYLQVPLRPPTPDTDTGALAQQMEEQLMQEFEALLASRRKEQQQLGGGGGAKPSSSCSSSSSLAVGGSRKVCAVCPVKENSFIRSIDRSTKNAHDGGFDPFIHENQQDGQHQHQQQEARDAVYWKHMYERLRDLRETEPERVRVLVLVGPTWLL